MQGSLFLFRAFMFPVLGPSSHPSRPHRRSPGRLWATLALLLVCCSSLRGAGFLDPARSLTQFKNDVWQTEQGLPLNTVQALLQTRDGYLWVGTLGGLARFDGVRFTVFDALTTPELQGVSSVLSLMEDAEGNLWIGRTGGATLYRKGRFQAAFGAALVGGARVWSFCQTPDGVVWAATDRGLVRWEKGATRVYGTKDGLPIERLRALACGRDGTLWIGTTGGGLVSFAGGRFETFSTAQGLPHPEVRAVLADPDGSIWAATAGGGLAQLRAGRIRTWNTGDGLTSNQLSSLARDAAGTLWIGTWGAGLCRMRDGRFSGLSTAEGLSGSQIWSLCADNEGSLWVGTWVGGLNRLRNRRFVALGTPEGLSHDNTRAVLQARDGSIWVATAGGGVNHIQGERVTTIRKQDGLASDETASLCETQDGSLWIGTYTAGAVRLRRGRMTTFGLAEGLPGTDIRTLFQDQGGTLWAGTTSGLARFDGHRFSVVKKDGASIDGVITALQDHTGTLWFGTAGRGLVRIRDGVASVLGLKDGLPSDYVMALYEDRRGSLWIGTNGAGLGRYRAGRFATVHPADGLWDGIVQTLLEDRSGRLWMTCNRGFSHVSMDELDAFAEGRLAKVTSVGYGPADALRSVTFSGGQFPAGIKDAQGRLWFPTFKGLVVVDEGELPEARPAPPVALEEITVNGVVQAGDAPIVLPPGSVPLSIRYTAMTLLDAERTRFRYRMDGLSSEWVEAGTRRDAFFPSLPHGHWRFRIAASTDGVTWREAETTLPITVRSFFYQTVWFYTLVGAGALALARLVVRVRTLQLRRHNAEMQRLVQEKTEALRLANEHLSRLSFLDALTGLANRRRFDEALEKEWRRAMRFGTSLALVMADVDHFKLYNDTFGHPEGDRCLAAVAGVLRNALGRAGDLAARYGGEEFVVLVPGLDRAGALALAESLRASCEALAMPHPGSPVAPVVTISLGAAACHPGDTLSMASLLADADAALYEAKHAGRNLVR